MGGVCIIADGTGADVNVIFGAATEDPPAATTAKRSTQLLPHASGEEPLW